MESNSSELVHLPLLPSHKATREMTLDMQFFISQALVSHQGCVANEGLDYHSKQIFILHQYQGSSEVSGPGLELVTDFSLPLLMEFLIFLLRLGLLLPGNAVTLKYYQNM